MAVMINLLSTNHHGQVNLALTHTHTDDLYPPSKTISETPSRVILKLNLADNKLASACKLHKLEDAGGISRLQQTA